MASRALNFATIIYPEDFENESVLYDSIDNMHVQAVLSPLHDKDKTEEGSIKKVHHHLLMMFESIKTTAQVEECLSSSGVFHRGVMVCVSKKAYARYLCHIDSPEKAQYDINNCVFFSGASPHLLDKEIEVNDALGRIIDYVKTYEFAFWCDLIDFLRLHDYDMYNYVTHNTQSFVLTYIKSYAFKRNKLKGI